MGRHHAPIDNSWTVVHASREQVVLSALCQCGSDYCGWTIISYREDMARSEPAIRLTDV